MKQLIVAPILFYLKFWAKVALFIHKPTTIGIAGSVGKSSTRNALFAILKSHAKTKMVSGNSETGVPLGMLGIEINSYSIAEWVKIILTCPFKIFSLTSYKYLIVEMGIDDPYPPKNMGYLLSIVKPDIAISLNVAATHTMQFEKLLHKKDENESKSEFLLKKIAEEDTKIITKSNCRVGIYNQDDKYIVNAVSSFKGKTLTFGENGYASYKGYVVSEKGTTFEIQIDEHIYKVNIKDQALPVVYRELFAAVLLCAQELGINLTSAVDSIERNFTLPKGRSSIFSAKNDSLVIDSSYNSSKIAVFAFVDLLKLISKDKKKKAVFIMGDMRELGNEAESEHKEVAKRINDGIDTLYCVGPLTAKYVMPNVGDTVEKHHFSTSKSLAKYLSENFPKNSVILAKGSQNEIYLEEAIKPLLRSSDDEKKLCRQNSYWMRIKNEYFSSY